MSNLGVIQENQYFDFDAKKIKMLQSANGKNFPKNYKNLEARM